MIDMNRFSYLPFWIEKCLLRTGQRWQSVDSGAVWTAGMNLRVWDEETMMRLSMGAEVGDIAVAVQNGHTCTFLGSLYFPITLLLKSAVQERARGFVVLVEHMKDHIRTLCSTPAPSPRQIAHQIS